MNNFEENSENLFNLDDDNEYVRGLERQVCDNLVKNEMLYKEIEFYKAAFVYSWLVVAVCVIAMSSFMFLVILHLQGVR